jgi:hypothetical protein
MAFRMKSGPAMLAGLILLTGASSAVAQSKGYRPPPPPPPVYRPSPPPPVYRPSPPVTSAPRPMSPPPSRPQALTAPRPTSPGPKPSAPTSTPKSGTTQKAPDYAKLNPSELQKTIASDNRQIESYRSKVNNPAASYPNWSSLSRERQGALMRQWNDEIRRHETSRSTAQRMLGQKTR